MSSSINSDAIDAVTEGINGVSILDSMVQISDEDLFKQPPPNEDCPLCFIRMPWKERIICRVVEKVYVADVDMRLSMMTKAMKLIVKSVHSVELHILLQKVNGLKELNYE